MVARASAHAPSQAPPPAAGGIVHTRIVTHRADVERQNILALADLPGEAHVFDAEDADAGGACARPAALSPQAAAKAKEALAQRLSLLCPAPARLRLKVGAQVLLLRSVAPARGLVNGARGVVTAFAEDGSVRAIDRPSSMLLTSFALIADANNCVPFAMLCPHSACPSCASRAA